MLNGVKCWISGVAQADWYTVFAKTGDPSSRRHDSIIAFIVERGDAGVSVGSIDNKMGVRGVDTGELFSPDVRVPPENVIGEVGGFRLAMLGLNSMRPVVAARGIGLAEGALMYAVEYAKQRSAFGGDGRRVPGHPVGDRQARRRDRVRPALDLPGLLGWPTRACSAGNGSRICQWPSTSPRRWR